MDTILIIEDNVVYSQTLAAMLSSKLKVGLLLAEDFKSAKKILSVHANEISIALIDFYLPDSEKGESIDLVNNYNIPIIVITASMTDEIEGLIKSKKVIDYVIKEGPHSLDFIVSTVDRLLKNRFTKILVVDDSPTAQVQLRNMLEPHCYQVLEALTGSDAMKIISSNNDIKIIILDYNLPDTDGITLIRQIRSSYPMNKLSIIGLSDERDPKISVQFIKWGANDFISKPFVSEQLYCRLTMNLTLLEQIDSIYELSITDHLTKMYNRRHFFELADNMFKNSSRQKLPIAVAMIDIDFFKKVNDTYGHVAGDTVLTSIASVLKKSFREADVVGRYGGEEFCVLASNMKKADALRIFERFRKRIENMSFKISDNEFHVTVSIGLCCDTLESLGDMIKIADENLYTSKKTGRNKIT